MQHIRMILRRATSQVSIRCLSKKFQVLSEPALGIIVSRLKQASVDGDWHLALGAFQHFATTYPTAVQTQHANIVLRCCAEQGRPREAKKVIHIMRQIGIELDTDTNDSAAASTSSSSLSMQNLYSKALVCVALAEHGKGKEALEETRKLVAFALNNATIDERTIGRVVYKPLLQALKSNRPQKDWQWTLGTLHQMQEFNIPISNRGYRLLLMALHAGRQPEKLVDVAQQVVRTRAAALDVATITVLIKTLSAAGKHAAVQDVLSTVQTASKLTSSHHEHKKNADWWTTLPDVNVRFFNALIRASMLAGQMDTCYAQFRHMLVTFKPEEMDAFAGTNLMLGFLQQHAPESAVQVFLEMQKHGIAPSVLTLACTLRAMHELERRTTSRRGSRHSHSSLGVRKEDIVSQIATTRLDRADFLHTIIDALEDVGESDYARRVFERALVENDQLTVGWRKGLYHLNLHSFSKGSAKAAVHVALADLATQPQSHLHFLDVQDLKIVTGKGQHSREFMKPVLKPEIQALLQRHFHLPSFSPAQNPGCIIVLKEHLKQWMDKRAKTPPVL